MSKLCTGQFQISVRAMNHHARCFYCVLIAYIDATMQCTKIKECSLRKSIRHKVLQAQRDYMSLKVINCIYAVKMGHCAKQHMGHVLLLCWPEPPSSLCCTLKRPFFLSLSAGHISRLVNSHPTGEGTAAKCAHICHSKMVVRQRKRARQYGKES